MSSIQWNASTVNTFFKSSFNQSSTSSMSRLYDSLGDASLIKSGSYSKLMKAYYEEMKKKDSAKTETSEQTEQTTKSSTADTYDSHGVKNQTAESILDTLV